MKLLSKLTLYATVSKTAIVLLFIALLPGMISGVASRYTNYYLREQQKKVLEHISKNGVGYYFEGDSTYGSYTMLKDEYISLEPAPAKAPADSILTARRIVETDTLNYRLLNHVFEYRHKKYLLEIGKTVAAINQYNRPLQRVALYSLAALIAITLVFDLLFMRLLLRPLGLIIRSKLQHRKFPFKEIPPEVNTSTSDFKYLDQSLISLMTKIRVAFEKEREFTSNASHELMTPISILQNKIENLLMDTEIDEAAQEKISGMLVTLQRLKKIVRSLLLISRIENEQFAKMDGAEPQALLNEVAAELQDKLDARGIEMQQSFSATHKLHNINHDLLFQLFYNLVNNAIRYNREAGSIQVSDKFSKEKGYAIVVTDTGIGIPENEQAGIFDRFKKSGSSAEEGYGLGLSIVKSIALYHQINIELRSLPGKGSSFSVWFPPSLLTAGSP